MRPVLKNEWEPKASKERKMTNADISVLTRQYQGPWMEAFNLGNNFLNQHPSVILYLTLICWAVSALSKPLSSVAPAETHGLFWNISLRALQEQGFDHTPICSSALFMLAQRAKSHHQKVCVSLSLLYLHLSLGSLWLCDDWNSHKCPMCTGRSPNHRKSPRHDLSSVTTRASGWQRER